ncbi:MAG: hypothetical protein AAF752_12190 [Bacteroidota bacterium]
MTGVLFASADAAILFAERYTKGRLTAPREGSFQAGGSIVFGVTGLGKIKTTLRTEQLLAQHPEVERVLHAGLCTSLHGTLDLGSIVQINRTVEGDRIEIVRPSYARMPVETALDDEQYPKVTLITQDHAPSTEEQAYWQRIGQVTDSSGYAVSYVAGRRGTPSYILRGIAGIAGQDDPNFIQTRTSVQSNLADAVLEALATFEPKE